MKKLTQNFEINMEKKLLITWKPNLRRTPRAFFLAYSHPSISFPRRDILTFLSQLTLLTSFHYTPIPTPLSHIPLTFQKTFRNFHKKFFFSPRLKNHTAMLVPSYLPLNCMNFPPHVPRKFFDFRLSLRSYKGNSLYDPLNFQCFFYFSVSIQARALV